jgi:hypothetical protein
MNNDDRRPTRPSPWQGARRALALWHLTLAVWLLPYAAFLPAVLVVEVALAGRLAALPPQRSSLSDGLLILSRAVPQVGPGLALAVLAGCLLLWLWTVLWHAGVVHWHQEGAGREARLAELVGHGVLAFWPFLRLSLTALAGLALGLFAVAIPLALGFGRAHEAMAEVVMEALVGLSLPLGLLLLATCWCATLRGAWLLAVDPRRSALRAWWSGLVQSVRSPRQSLATLGLWALPAVVLGLLPLLLGAAVPVLRGGLGGTLLSALAGLGRAFSAVALLMSFAPQPASPAAGTSATSRELDPDALDVLGSASMGDEPIAIETGSGLSGERRSG